MSGPLVSRPFEQCLLRPVFDGDLGGGLEFVELRDCWLFCVEGRGGLFTKQGSAKRDRIRVCDQTLWPQGQRAADDVRILRLYLICHRSNGGMAFRSLPRPARRRP